MYTCGLGPVTTERIVKLARETMLFWWVVGIIAYTYMLHMYVQLEED